jgi:uncharacterized protein (TIGR04222 family)
MTDLLHMKGPEFLVFYISWGAGIFLLAWLARLLWRWMAQTAVPGARWAPGIYPVEGDAYAIALLRGGTKEVAVTALGRLVAEGFLHLEKDALHPNGKKSADRSRLAAIEEQALAACGSSSIAPPEALSRVVRRLEPKLSGVQTDLEMSGLAPGADQRAGYHVIGLVALLLVTGLGLLKLFVALGTGHKNVLFLIILLVISLILGVALTKPPLQTVAGARYLKWLKSSHQGLVKMVGAGRRQSFGELALVAGIFGLEILPTLAPLKRALIPPPSTSSGGGDTTGCGGGGGCGGGCGGCGG